MPARLELLEVNLQYQAKADLYKIGLYRKLRGTMDMSWLLGFQTTLLAIAGIDAKKTATEIMRENTKAYAQSCVRDKLPSPSTMVQSYQIGMKTAHAMLRKSLPDTIMDDIQVLHRKLGLMAHDLEETFTGKSRIIYDRAKTKSGIDS